MAKANDARKVKPFWFWLVVCAALLLLILLLRSATFNNLITESTGWAKNVIEARPVLGAAIFFLFSAVSAMLAFASSVVLVPPANLVWGKPVTFLLLWGGWMAGAIAAYGIGRLARPMLIRLGYRETVEKYQNLVSRRMRFWVAVLFCIAVPSEVPGYLFGGLHYSFVKFIGAIAIAESIYALGIVIAGESLLEARPWPLIIIIVSLLLIATIAGWLVRKFRRR